MFRRRIEEKLKFYAEKYRCIAVVGARQTGKTTTCRSVFDTYEYVSLENPDTRDRVQGDPRGFLASLKNSVILDEIQNTPDFISYLQEVLDDPKDKRRFVLTGSNSFTLNENISQSLAGRVRIVYMAPLCFNEVPNRLQSKEVDRVLWHGLYPRPYHESLDPVDWYADYYNTYLQKDVRNILNVENLTSFDRFIRICAGRSGQLSDYSTMASEVGIAQPTASRWASVLEASFITFRLQPHFKNFNKRIIKSPKIYFYDTGLLCYLLRISSPSVLNSHPLRAHIFENWVVAELTKLYLSDAKEAPVYFWRDQHGHEVDIVIDVGGRLELIEVKSGATFTDDWLKSLIWLGELQDYRTNFLVYGGDKNFLHQSTSVFSWQDVDKLYGRFT